MTDRRPLLCLDMDGVLHGYQSGWLGADRMPDPPVPGAMEALRSYIGTFRVAVYSSRTCQPGGLCTMQHWLRQHLVRELGALEGNDVYDLVEWPLDKPPALVTIDDRALTFDGTWPSVEALASFQPWNRVGNIGEGNLDEAIRVAFDLSYDVIEDLSRSNHPWPECRPAKFREMLATHGYRIVRV